MVALVKRINANSRIIEAVGTQMHLQANASGGVQSVLELLATTGLPVAITELDIVNAASNDYVAVAKACLAVSACVGITSWGVSDAVGQILFLQLMLANPLFHACRTRGFRAPTPSYSTGTTRRRLLTTHSSLLCKWVDI